MNTGQSTQQNTSTGPGQNTQRQQTWRYAVDTTTAIPIDNLLFGGMILVVPKEMNSPQYNHLFEAYEVILKENLKKRNALLKKHGITTTDPYEIERIVNRLSHDRKEALKKDLGNPVIMMPPSVEGAFKPVIRESHDPVPFDVNTEQASDEWLNKNISKFLSGPVGLLRSSPTLKALIPFTGYPVDDPSKNILERGARFGGRTVLSGVATVGDTAYSVYDLVKEIIDNKGNIVDILGQLPKAAWDALKEKYGSVEKIQTTISEDLPGFLSDLLSAATLTSAVNRGLGKLVGTTSPKIHDIMYELNKSGKKINENSLRRAIGTVLDPDTKLPEQPLKTSDWIDLYSKSVHRSNMKIIKDYLNATWDELNKLRTSGTTPFEMPKILTSPNFDRIMSMIDQLPTEVRLEVQVHPAYKMRQIWDTLSRQGNASQAQSILYNYIPAYKKVEEMLSHKGIGSNQISAQELNHNRALLLAAGGVDLNNTNLLKQLFEPRQNTQVLNIDAAINAIRSDQTPQFGFAPKYVKEHGFKVIPNDLKSVQELFTNNAAYLDTIDGKVYGQYINLFDTDRIEEAKNISKLIDQRYQGGTTTRGGPLSLLVKPLRAVTRAADDFLETTGYKLSNFPVTKPFISPFADQLSQTGWQVLIPTVNAKVQDVRLDQFMRDNVLYQALENYVRNKEENPSDDSERTNIINAMPPTLRLLEQRVKVLQK